MLPTLLLLALPAHAGEQRIDPAALPLAVTAAVQARLPGAVVVGAAREGKAFEAQVTLGDRRLDLAFAKDGTWLEEEERVVPDALPAPVKATLASRWEGWSIERAERATTPKGTVFEVLVRSGDRLAEAVLADDGVVKRVEGGEDDEETDLPGR